ncbi:MAG: Holliday junction resolvase RecU [Mycoplasmataceae bacterium]|jgi:recombination protein U|nr:Holliday junction resolvase RecU [Mycoplasmataceae bacterium]
MVYNNRGMFAEEIINRSISYFQGKVYIEKRELKIKIIKSQNNDLIVGKLLGKSFVDYFGFYNQIHFEFEVKQTEKEYFDINLIKKHQLEHLKNISALGVKSFIIVYMYKYDKFYVIPYLLLQQYIDDANRQKIPVEVLNKISKTHEIIYPGVINFVDICKSL